jgi:hypothetical protein
VQHEAVNNLKLLGLLVTVAAAVAFDFVQVSWAGRMSASCVPACQPR